MSVVLCYVWLIVGFVCLIKGADFFVEGSSSIAKLLKIPSVIVGLTIVAMGTSLPEASVSLSAALAGSNGIAVGNVVGSNFFNLLMIVGMCALFHPVIITKDILRRDFPFSIIITIILLGFVYIGSNFSIEGTADYGVAQAAGWMLLLLFIIYIVWLVHSAVKSRAEQEESTKVHGPLKSVLFILIGVVAIIVGGNLVVNSAKVIAASFGMSETLIGLTIVALGTSLPELVTSIVAAKKNESDMALGNVIGSNIFNILFVLGISASVHPIELGASGIESIIDLALLIFANIVVLIMALKSNTFRFKAGITMVLMYVLYLIYILARNYNMLPF